MTSNRSIAALAALGVVSLTTLLVRSPEPGPEQPLVPEGAPATRQARATVPPAAPVAALDISVDSLEEEASIHFEDRVMVGIVDGFDAALVARAAGGSLLRAPGRSGYATVLVPENTTRAEVLQRLQADVRVELAAPVGITRGAGKDSQKGKQSTRTTSTETSMSIESTWSMDSSRSIDLPAVESPAALVPVIRSC